ncbi:MAG: signal peptidase I [Verrucomicrobiota bacterium]
MGLFSSPAKKVRKEAKHLLQLSQKVIHYRKDVIGPEAVAAIQVDQQLLMETYRDKTATDKLKGCIEKLDTTLKPHGGSIYPMTFWSEHIEMILVAAILAIGVRSFFLQPFKIPTNSMYPTYAGMVGEAYPAGEGAPGSVEQLWRFITLGATNYSLAAPSSGRVEIPVAVRQTPVGLAGNVQAQTVPAKRFFILSSQKRRYTFAINGQRFSVDVPLDFSLDDVVAKSFFPGRNSLSEVLLSLSAENLQRLRDGQTLLSELSFEQGQPALDFDILTGDMLFVDRFTYNFAKPEVGDPFVFRTDKIEGLRSSDGSPDDKYYIKRLVGVPGDVLEIRPPYLYRNGKPIEGAPAFARNFEQEGLYNGYEFMGWMKAGDTELIPPGYFFAVGDNSPQSYDSRGWASPDYGNIYAPATTAKIQGEPVNMVPETEVVGQAIFIFYPFSSRWGIAE